MFERHLFFPVDRKWRHDFSCTRKPSHERENSDNIDYDLGKMSTGERQKQCVVATTVTKKSNVVGFQQLQQHNGATTGKDETEILVRIFIAVRRAFLYLVTNSRLRSTLFKGALNSIQSVLSSKHMRVCITHNSSKKNLSFLFLVSKIVISKLSISTSLLGHHEQSIPVSNSVEGTDFPKQSFFVHTHFELF